MSQNTEVWVDRYSMTALASFLLALVSAKKYFTGVDKALVAGTKRDETVNQTEATKYLIILKAANRYLNDETVLIFEGRPTKISLFAFCFYIYQDALFRQTTKYITQ